MTGAGHPDEPEARLAWPAHRGGQDLVVSVVPPRRQGERGFQPVDVVAQADEDDGIGAQIAGLASSLTRAAEAGGTVAIQGFAAPRPGTIPMTFVLAVSLADIPYPEAGELPEGNVAQFDLPCGPGVRVQRLAQTATEPPLGLFTATYLAQTDHGVLALAFATPHLDGAPEFAVLFDVIARSCAVQSAPSAPAT